MEVEALTKKMNKWEAKGDKLTRLMTWKRTSLTDVRNSRTAMIKCEYEYEL